MKEKCSTKYMRERLGCTQAEFAEAYGMPLRTLQGWERNGTMPGWVRDLLYALMWAELEPAADLDDVDEAIRKGFERRLARQRFNAGD